MKRINKILKLFNLKLNRISIDANEILVDIIGDREFMELYSMCKSYTMTSIERLYALYLSVKYIIDNDIKGDFVECGVWKGGSSMLIAKMLADRKIFDRKLYLYDTFEGMPEPTEKDITFNGKDARSLLKLGESNKENSVWCLAYLDDVRKILQLTKFPEHNMVFVKGKVEETIPDTMPAESISLLRLDTDWYESTKHELEFLFPKLVENGVLIIDDFGHWEGAKQAVLEYLKETKQTILLNRIDYTGRIGIKCSKLQ